MTRAIQTYFVQLKLLSLKKYLVQVKQNKVSNISNFLFLTYTKIFKLMNNKLPQFRISRPSRIASRPDNSAKLVRRKSKPESLEFQSVPNYDPKYTRASSSVRSPRSKNIDDETFGKLLNPKKAIELSLSQLAILLYEHTTGTDQLYNTIVYLKKLAELLSMTKKDFQLLVSLCEVASENCPDDILFLLLSLAARNINEGLHITRSEARPYLNFACKLKKKDSPYIIFGGNKEISRRHIEELIKVFTTLQAHFLTFDMAQLHVFTDDSEAKSMEIIYSGIPVSDILASAKKFKDKYLSKEQRERYALLAKDLCDWENVYFKTRELWIIINKEDDFNIIALTSMMNLSFAEYVLTALREFALDDTGSARYFVKI